MTRACPSHVPGSCPFPRGWRARTPSWPAWGSALPVLALWEVFAGVWICGCTAQFSAEYLRASPCSSPELCVQPLPACPSSSSRRLPTLTALSLWRGSPSPSSAPFLVFRPETLTSVSRVGGRAHLILSLFCWNNFPSLPGVQVLKAVHLLYFVWFSMVSGERINPIPGT